MRKNAFGVSNMEWLYDTNRFIIAWVVIYSLVFSLANSWQTRPNFQKILKHDFLIKHTVGALTVERTKLFV